MHVVGNIGHVVVVLSGHPSAFLPVSCLPASTQSSTFYCATNGFLFSRPSSCECIYRRLCRHQSALWTARSWMWSQAASQKYLPFCDPLGTCLRAFLRRAGCRNDIDRLFVHLLEFRRVFAISRYVTRWATEQSSASYIWRYTTMDTYCRVPRR